MYAILEQLKIFCVFCICRPDDGVSPDRVAQVMGQPDHCHHAVHLINELVQTAQVCPFCLHLFSFWLENRAVISISKMHYVNNKENNATQYSNAEIKLMS